MSSYIFKAIHKATGEEVEVFAMDDYFAHHEYGYKLPDKKVLRHEDFWKQYQRKNMTEEYVKKSDVMACQDWYENTRQKLCSLPTYTFPEPEQKPEIQLMPIRDLSAKTGNAAKEIIGRPLGYCLKTGKLWPKPDKPYDIFVVLGLKNGMTYEQCVAALKTTSEKDSK